MAWRVIVDLLRPQRLAISAGVTFSRDQRCASAIEVVDCFVQLTAAASGVQRGRSAETKSHSKLCIHQHPHSPHHAAHGMDLVQIIARLRTQVLADLAWSVKTNHELHAFGVRRLTYEILHHLATDGLRCHGSGARTLTPTTSPRDPPDSMLQKYEVVQDLCTSDPSHIWQKLHPTNINSGGARGGVRMAVAYDRLTQVVQDFVRQP